jgi:hypothetical protein
MKTISTSSSRPGNPAKTSYFVPTRADVFLANIIFYPVARKDDQMQTLTIAAASPESARALLEALSQFRVELLGDDAVGYEVTVKLGGSDREIVAVLNAIERYVTDRSSSAQILLNGRSYVLHPEAGQPASNGDQLAGL